MVDGQRVKRNQYPMCPNCGSPVACRPLMSQSVYVQGAAHFEVKNLWMFCSNGDCNYQQSLASLRSPISLRSPRLEETFFYAETRSIRKRSNPGAIVTSRGSVVDRKTSGATVFFSASARASAAQ